MIFRIEPAQHIAFEADPASESETFLLRAKTMNFKPRAHVQLDPSWVNIEIMCCVSESS